MDEILQSLQPGSLVLDLGSASGSFDAGCHLVVRLDLEFDTVPQSGIGVRADASCLPFLADTFDAVVCNHILEHVEDLDRALDEIGRVLKRPAALFVSVPDSTTFSDRLYRWLGSGGGHVNAFEDAPKLARRIEGSTGLPLIRTLTLYSSFSFLNRRADGTNPPRKARWSGLSQEATLRWLSFLAQMSDRLLSTRISLYGWALYFGDLPFAVETRKWTNVCIRCGRGSSAAGLLAEAKVDGYRLFFRAYSCERCGALNLLTSDPG